MDKKKILIMMMEAGNGHKIPALAIQKYIQSTYPDQYNIEVIDFAKHLGGKFFDTFYKKGWKFSLRHPNIFSVTYKWSNFKNIKKMERIAMASLIPRVEELIKESKPSLIVSTHFSSSNILALLKSKDKLNVPSISVNIDAFDSHYLWIHPEMDTIVFSDKAKTNFIKKGVDELKLKKFNYCLRSDFSLNLPSKDELRDKLGLDKEKFTLLISAGGEGIGNIDKILKGIIKEDMNIQVVVITGRNKKLLDKLRKINPNKTKVVVLGYVNNMQEFVKAADLVCGKAGANFTFETLVLKKPIIHTYSMTNEIPTRDFIILNKLGWYIEKPAELVSFVKNLLEDKTEFRSIENNVESLNFTPGTKDVSEYLLTLIK